MHQNTEYQHRSHNPFSSRIGRRIIFITIFLSGVVTLAITLMQTYFDYDREFNDVTQRHEEIELIHAPLLASSLWAFDLLVMQERLDGLVNLPKVDYLMITSGNYKFEAGKRVKEEIVASRFPLNYTNNGHTEHIGDIYIESNAREIYRYLLEKFLLTLAVNAAKTLLVCSLILVVFHISINNRVFSIARYLRNYNPRHPTTPLQLSQNRLLIAPNDEISWLGWETNRLTKNLNTLYNGIRLEKERLEDFSLVASDWLWETDQYGKLSYCSDPMLKFLNCDIDMIKDHRFQDIEIFNQTQNLSDYIAKKQNFNLCEESIVLDQVSYHLLFQAKALYQDQRFVGFRGTVINISELKRAQIDLQTLNDNLEQTVAERTRDLKQSMERLQQTQEQLVEAEKLASLGGLVAGVAHEVNTPLGIAVTATSVINESCQALTQAFNNQTLSSEQFTDLVQRMEQSGVMLEHNLNRASKLIRDFKQTAVDQVSEARCQFTAQNTLDALLASLTPETRKAKVTPELHCPDDIKMISLPGVLSQVVSNLILNSINHAFDKQPEPKISIDVSQQDEWVIVEFRDNGSGVDPKLHKKIFEPFYTSKRGHGGSGLGLNLVFNLVTQKLKGELIFESEVNQGVYFYIKLPKELPLNQDTVHEFE